METEYSQETQELRALREVLGEITTLKPDINESFRAQDAAEQESAFLSGTIDEPHRDYAKLGERDYVAIDARFTALGEELQRHPDVDPKQRFMYAAFLDDCRKVNALQHNAAIITGDQPESVKAEAAANYKALNESLYGAVDVETYHTLIASKIRDIQVDPEDTRASGMLDELRSMFSSNVLDHPGEPYRPTDATFNAVKIAVEALYGGMTSHIPDRETRYTSEEIRDVFEEIIQQEFGESAAGWNVIRKKQSGLSVEASEKEVRVSNGMTKDAAGLRGLMIHEVGVHMLRAIRGEETGLLPLELGLADYSAAEEGLGMVMQQAYAGEYVPAGVGHYITAGFITEGHSFRETFDMKWRLAVLEKYDPAVGITDAVIQKAQETAYGNVMRIMRGTDTLPYLRDLSYYNGAVTMWKYFEQHAGDELMLNIALLGKIDPSRSEHRRSALESSMAREALKTGTEI